MKKKIIARISNGLGNQMFLYAASFVLAKKIDYNLFLDVQSGIDHDIKRNKDKTFKHYKPKYELGIFNLSANILKPYSILFSKLNYIKRKINIFFDKFREKKKLIIEKKNFENKNFFNYIDTNKISSDIIHIEGYFECEKYFNDFNLDQS